MMVRLNRQLHNLFPANAVEALRFDESAIYSTLTARFEEVVRNFPDQIALRSGTTSLTYAQLNEQANRLAHAIIRARGAVSEPIPFLLEHGGGAIQAILGILKAGKAYVPVDPFYPRAWITHILDDIHADLVITNYQNLPLAMTSLAVPNRTNVLNLDTLEENLPVENLNVPNTSQDLAYILYTSGTTGTPKGVIHSHADVLQNMVAQTNDLQLLPSDRFAVFISFGFEASRFAFYGGLLNGGTVCVYDIRTEGLGGLPEWVTREGITVLLSTPSTFRHMLHLIPKHQRFEPVRVIVLGGEPVTSQDVALYRAHFDESCILVNVLGMTETGIIARMKIDQRSPFQGHSLPAGFPIGDKQIVLADENGQPVPAQEIGEILVRSRHLSPGYWRLPSLTAEKFVTDPKDPEWRIFHTGDLGMIRADGSLEHLGRKDSQIKIRGFRVDPAIIEAVLQQYPGVENSAVIARELKHAADNKQLVAYIELSADKTISKKELREYLSGQLPDYFVPPIIVFLDKLPLTPTGKVNRGALPEPERVGQAQENVYIAPRDSIELQLAAIWEKVLKTKPIGVRDDYFELGGNSLLAAQLFAQIEKAFGKKLPLATLFQAATIEEQANVLKQDDWVPNWSSLVALRAGGTRPPIFLAAPVGGNVLSYRDLMMRLNKSIPCYGLQALGLDGVQTVHRNVNEIAAHYVTEVLKVDPDGPYYLAGSSFGGLVAYEMAQRLHDLGKPVAMVIMFDAYGPGYPRRLPSTSRLRRKLFKYLRRVDTHLSNLRYTDWQGRMAYMRVKVPKLTNRISRRLRNKIDQTLHPVPRQLQRVQSAHMGAAKKRKRHMREPRRFGGRLVLFRAEKQPLGIYPDPKLGWGAVVGEDIEVFEIPGHHTSIIYEPRVHLLTEHLNRVLMEDIEPPAQS
ncbi:MAG: hypothetical protein B6D39_06985 [Anaerolineae bacterium UTCFX2]|jgi:amino acid adenylation domain-containing protein|nr:MAG: hypothetical protein B6D39_06985 [Anaerolineae bacterium UTCFX2]